MPGMRSAATTALLALPLVLAPAAPAVAAPPDRWSFAVDDTFPSRTSEDCGFDILLHLEGTIVDLKMATLDDTTGRWTVTGTVDLTKVSALDGSSRPSWYASPSEVPAPSNAPSTGSPAAASTAP